MFCTIATASHAPAALACLRSLGARHPASRLVLLAVGRVQAAGVEVLAVERCVPAAVLAGMRSRYTAAELCFAVKPFLLAHLLEQAAQVHYLDGDCLAFAPLQPLVAQLDGADLLLTPHALAPIPDDGRTPHPLTVLRGGAFNGGYLGVRNTAEGLRFARWLGDMTQRYARNAPDAGMCGDQRWLDLVPALFPGAAVCRHPGANAAYWNLHERPLTLEAPEAFRVNGAPLLFFHFSGYRAARPRRLSVHQDRHPVPPGSALDALLAAYRQALRQEASPRPALWRRALGLSSRP